MTSLFVRPCHDDVTSYLYYYSKYLVEFSKSKDFKTINKEKEKANQSEVVNVINISKFIMFNGHGNEECICGHNDKIIIKYKENHLLLKNKIIYALSCSSALVLGKSVGDEKTNFIGYDEDFALGMDINCQASVYRDKRARFFLEPSNLLVKCLLKGNKVIDAVKKAKDLMKKNISRLRTDPFPDAVDYIPYLFNNYLALNTYGNNDLKLD